MVEWFHERYISRDEHQEIVDYYKKQSMLFYRELRELRTRVDAANLDSLIEHSRQLTERELQKQQPYSGDNVIPFNLRRPH